MHYLSLLAATLLSTVANAHMNIVIPTPFRYSGNRFTTSIDYNIRSPLNGDGSDYPCKGYHLDGGAAVSPVDTWVAGSVQNFTMGAEGAIHGGGSCQASISEDNGKTFRVIRSYIGDCPASGGVFPFTVPKETKAGNVLFAWTWFNQIGNREMYMNCAAITISGGGSGLSALPEIFKANIGSQSPGCTTEEKFDTQFPNPGADVVMGATAKPQLPPAGCGSPSAPASSTPPASSASHVAVPISAAPPASSAASVPVPVSTAVSTEGCMCSCGGPGGYIVNIMPAGPVMSVQNATDAHPTTSSAPKRFRRI